MTRGFRGKPMMTPRFGFPEGRGYRPGGCAPNIGSALKKNAPLSLALRASRPVPGAIAPRCPAVLFLRAEPYVTGWR